MKNYKDNLWNYFKNFSTLNKQDQDFFLFGKLSEIWYRPGTFGKRSYRKNKIDYFHYNFYNIKIC